jgi:GNAT superfamily N-acetyltransferase
MNGDLSFHLDRRPEVEAIRALYAASPLRRPIHDFVFDGYVCDLAIHPDFQKAGVGRRLLDLAQGLGEGIEWILQASPLARDYYAHIGWERVGNGWRLPRSGWKAGTTEAFQAEHADLAAKA